MDMLWTVLGIIGIIVVLIIILFNHIVGLNNRCNNAWSGIDNQLKRRVDLIPNLVEVTKGYAKYESETLVEVINTRNNGTVSDIAKQSEKISNSLSKLLALTEAYPDLKANKLYENLQTELTGTEDKIAFARQFYNDCVQHYNTSIQQFPNNIIANKLHFQPKAFFKVEDKDREVVRVSI